MRTDGVVTSAAGTCADTAATRARTRFWLLWAVLLAARTALAAFLPAFGDEAF